MHVRDLVELGARIAVCSKGSPQDSSDHQARDVQTYWSASKCLIERWTRAIGRQSELIQQHGVKARPSWRRAVPLLQEVLCSELVTRLVAAAGSARDAARKEAELGPVARNILTAHLDLRTKVLKLLLVGERLEVPEAKALNDLRRKVERWTDMLLAHFASTIDIQDFAFEPNRAKDFAEDLAAEGPLGDTEFACKLILSSLRGSLLTHLTAASPNADLNERIGSSLLCIFSEARDIPAGASGWLARISRSADDAQQMIDQMLEIDRAPL